MDELVKNLKPSELRKLEVDNKMALLKEYRNIKRTLIFYLLIYADGLGFKGFDDEDMSIKQMLNELGSFFRSHNVTKEDIIKVLTKK